MTNADVNAGADLPPVQRTEIDGVPVFWTDRPGRLSAELVFGVGIADESFTTVGITHLLEHLLMRQLGDADYESNATVGVRVTGFMVSGRPETVVAHLQALCAAISAPDLGPIDIERRILTAEVGHHEPPQVVSWPLSVRYGPCGPGLIDTHEFGVDEVGVEALLAWSRRFLHRNNAVLVLSAPPPPDLRLPLPDGQSVTHPEFKAKQLATPA